jgi:hypothetical protein
MARWSEHTALLAYDRAVVRTASNHPGKSRLLVFGILAGPYKSDQRSAGHSAISWRYIVEIHSPTSKRQSNKEAFRTFDKYASNGVLAR